MEKEKVSTRWLTGLLNCHPGKQRNGGDFTGICEVYNIDGERIWWEGSFSTKDLGEIATRMPDNECLFFIKGTLPPNQNREELWNYLVQNSAFILTRQKSFVILQDGNPLKPIIDIGKIVLHQINPHHLEEFRI